MTDSPGLHSNSMVVRMTREDAILHGLIELSGDELAKEKAERIQRSQVLAHESANARALPGPEVTIGRLLAQLGWSAEYAEHRLHPACYCYESDGETDLCEWAEWLGFTTPDDAPEPVTPAEVEAKAATKLAESIAHTEQWDGKPFRIRDLFPSAFVRLTPITYGQETP